MDDPHKDLRSLGDRLFDKRDLPIATGTSKADRTPAIAANMTRAKSFYFATDTGILWYSDGTTWTPASNSFGPRVYTANVEAESHFTTTTFGDPNISGPAGPTLTGQPDGTYDLRWGGSGTGDGASGGDQSYMAVLINGVTMTNFLETQLQGIHASVSRGDTVTVSNSNNNTFKCVYRTTLGHDADFRYRWLVATKYA